MVLNSSAALQRHVALHAGEGEEWVRAFLPRTISAQALTRGRAIAAAVAELVHVQLAELPVRQVRGQGGARAPPPAARVRAPALRVRRCVPDRRSGAAAALPDVPRARSGCRLRAGVQHRRGAPAPPPGEEAPRGRAACADARPAPARGGARAPAAARRRPGVHVGDAPREPVPDLERAAPVVGPQGERPAAVRCAAGSCAALGACVASVAKVMRCLVMQWSS